MFSIEQLAYLLESSMKYPNRPMLSDEIMSQFLLVFETMAKAAEQERPPAKKYIPEIAGFSNITKEIEDLQEALQVIDTAHIS